ncbi:sigma-70 family RNA polymerase sigma factor [Nesterenkonia halotolerans]|uniref:sigma-70 family RNA polymerase sigma factor n=1 Tax=Nesterenkonia halotolerans TaxID=225325 RepID=UPI003EE6CB59
MDHNVRNALVVENLPLVGYLVSDMCAKATHLSREDLTSVGSIALVTAADAFDPALGVPFGAYARRRIIGAFADDMRSADWAGRGSRKKIRELKTVEETLTAALGRAPSLTELAEALGLEEKVVAATQQDASRSVVALETDMSDYLVTEGRTPEQELVEAEQTAMLRTAVETLPERMRLIVSQLFFEGATVKDIAAQLGITHSAVSQQRSEAMKLLRDGLQTHYSAVEVQEPAPKASSRRRDQYLQELGERTLGGILQRARELKPAPLTEA